MIVQLFTEPSLPEAQRVRLTGTTKVTMLQRPLMPYQLHRTPLTVRKALRNPWAPTEACAAYARAREVRVHRLQAGCAGPEVDAGNHRAGRPELPGDAPYAQSSLFQSSASRSRFAPLSHRGPDSSGGERPRDSTHAQLSLFQSSLSSTDSMAEACASR